MLTATDFCYYQPRLADGSMAGLLEPNQAFPSEQKAIDWCDEHLDEEDVDIKEFRNRDIPNVKIIDYDETPIRKIESFSSDEIETLLTETVLHDTCDGIEGLKMERDEGETEDAFKDRIYGKALDLVNEAVCTLEESLEYDFSSYGGNPDTEWYDEARDGAVLTVTKWMLGE
ncbi:MAG: hypothetical protein IJ904_04140 [Candidatus Methanomethylophilaceae archaeon]|nr:hypothetical protein [Candidatus Methanomethylophilaceae archaeon]MBR6881378.1 hypothetical protein [Bacteroidales bacterium]